MNYEQRSDPGFILSTAWALVRETPMLAAVAVALLAAIDTANDRLPQLSQLTSIPALIASLAFQYGITFTLLERRGLAERGARARFWALLGLSILSGIGILLGFVLLVLPGLYLMVRWSVSVPVLIGERTGIIEALTRSGEEIEGRFWPVLAVSLVFWAAFALAGGVAFAFAARDSLARSIVVNLLVNAGLVGNWYAAVAIYVAGRPADDLAEVFA